MRISDWSSDVCSSDLTLDHRLLEACSNIFRCPLAGLLCTHARAFQACEGEVRIACAKQGPWQWHGLRVARRRRPFHRTAAGKANRQSVEEGQGVSVSVTLGGGVNYKNKKKEAGRR